MRLLYTFLLFLTVTSACSPVSPTGQASNPEPVSSMPPSSVTASVSAAATTPASSTLPANIPTLTTALSASDNSLFATPALMGNPTDTSIVISLLPVKTMEIVIRYEQSGIWQETSPVRGYASTPVEITLEDLKPDTAYLFEVEVDGKKSESHTFHTQRAAGSSFVFEIQGDSHPERDAKQFDAALYQKLLANAAIDEPDFYISMGDDFSVDALKTVTTESVQAIYLKQRQWFPLVDAPVFLVNGNHEQAALANLDGTAYNVAVWAQTSRKLLFPQPTPDDFYSGNSVPVPNIGLLRNYYAFTWGNTLFVVIDPYWHSSQPVDNVFGAGHSSKGQRNLWDVTLGEEQYQWFRYTLETSSARYKFVFAHHVNGTGRGGIEAAGDSEWGDAKNLSKYRPGWGKTIQQVMADAGVTIFFQGHDHIFARQELDGVIYQTLPEPANPFYSLENADAYLSGTVFPNSGRVRVTVSESGVQVEYIATYLDKPDALVYSYQVK